MPTFNNVQLIVNPAAGQPKPILHTVNRVFREHDINWDIALTRADGDGAKLARQAVADGADLVVSYGGDGTVKDVLNGLMDAAVPLAILHGGTGNALAYELGIPDELDDAVALICTENTLRGVDVGKVVCDDDPDTSGYFLLRTSIGLQTEVLETASRELKTRYGNLAYVIASVQSLSNPQARGFHFTIDGESVEVEGLTCMVTNSASVGGDIPFSFAPSVDPGDGRLDVFVFDARLDLDGILTGLRGGSLSDTFDKILQHRHGREIRVEVEPQQTATLDGEVFGKTPLTATIMPGAVQVVVPVTD